MMYVPITLSVFAGLIVGVITYMLIYDSGWIDWGK